MHSSEHAEGPGQSANFSQAAGKLDCRDRLFIPLVNQLNLNSEKVEKMLRVAIGGKGAGRNCGS